MICKICLTEVINKGGEIFTKFHCPKCNKSELREDDQIIYNMEALIKETWHYILGCSALIEDNDKRHKFRAFLNSYKTKFTNAPAAKGKHHAYRGGLIIHTKQVLEAAIDIKIKYDKWLQDISHESIYICSVLHDLSKIHQYHIQKNIKNPEKDIISSNKGWNMEKDIWIVAEAIKYDIQLTYDEIMGIMQAHGGRSTISSPTNKLACVIHCADTISAIFMKN